MIFDTFADTFNGENQQQLRNRKCLSGESVLFRLKEASSKVKQLVKEKKKITHFFFHLGGKGKIRCEVREQENHVYLA